MGVVDWPVNPSCHREPVAGRGHGEICHLISDDRALDGRDLQLADAVEAAVNFSFASLLCCVPGQLAVYFGEAPRQVVLLERPEGQRPAVRSGSDG